MDKKLIKIIHNNSQIFYDHEEIKIKVQLKNIPSLIVKLFEVNTQNYYKKNGTLIDSNIELDGLIATEETLFTFN